MNPENILDQSDFSGGINMVDDPKDLEQNQVSSAINFYIDKKRLVQRSGIEPYNANAIGASVKVRNFLQFKNKAGAQQLLVEANNGKVYYGTSEAPAGGLFWELTTEASTTGEPCFTSVDGMAVLTNGVEPPLIYEGILSQCQGLLITTNSGTTYSDYEVEVSDGSTATYAPLYSFPATTGFMYVGLKVQKATGFYINVPSSGSSSTVSAMTVNGWNGSSWTSVTSLFDGTKVGSSTLATAGYVTFTEYTNNPTLINNQYRYWYQITVSSALSATTKITAVHPMYNMQTLRPMWDGTLMNCSGFRKTTDGSVYINYTSSVTDGDNTTVANLNALDTFANNNCFIVSYTSKFEGVYFDLGASVNSSAATLTAEYCSSTWTALPIYDGTSTAGVTLAKDGYVWYALPTDWVKSDIAGAGVDHYQLRFMVSSALDASVGIAEVDVVPSPYPLENFKLCSEFKNRLVLANEPANDGHIRISAELNIFDYESDDTEELTLPHRMPITALTLFFNELFIGCVDRVFLLEGYSPETFGLLRVGSGDAGPVSNGAPVKVNKQIFFLHSTGIYMFDGTTVDGPIPPSRNIKPFFDSTNTTYGILNTNFSLVSGRYNKLRRSVEWAVAAGSVATVNNYILSLNIDSMGWTFQQYNKAPVCLGVITDLYGQEYTYSGSNDGILYRNDSDVTDWEGVAITATVVSRGLMHTPQLLEDHRMILVNALTQASGTVSISHAASGANSFTTTGTLSLVKAGYTYVWNKLGCAIQGTSLQVKVVNSTSGVLLTLLAIRSMAYPIRDEVVLP